MSRKMRGRQLVEAILLRKFVFDDEQSLDEYLRGGVRIRSVLKKEVVRGKLYVIVAEQYNDVMPMDVMEVMR